MKQLFAKISMLAMIISSFLSFANSAAAANTAKLYFTSAKTTYSVGEPIYLKVRVDPGTEHINVARAIFSWNAGLADFSSQQLDGAWPYPSPGSYTDTTARVLNQGGFVLSTYVSTDSQFMTAVFTPTAAGTLTFTFDPNSLLVDTDMINQMNFGLMTSYSVQIGAAPVVTPTPTPACGSVSNPCPPSTPVNHAPIINDIGEKIGYIGQSMSFDVTASDPDGDHVTLTASDMPAGASLSSSGAFSWTPTQQNIYFVTFTATDDSPLGPLSSDKTVRITIFCSAAGVASPTGSLTCPASGDVAGLVCPICSVDNQNFAKTTAVKLNPNIYSPSHPDQNAWYSLNMVNLRWEKMPSALGYSMTFNKIERSDPSTGYYNILDSQITYRDVPDGVWYFHLKVRYEDGWSQTYHYTVHVDTTSPALKISNSEAKDGKVSMYFSGSDVTSGIGHYEYRLNNKGDWSDAKNPLLLDQYSPGDTLALRALDKAGNAKEVNVSLQDFTQQGNDKDYVLYNKSALIMAPVIDDLITREVIGTVFPSEDLIFTGKADPLSTVELYLADAHDPIASGVADNAGRFTVIVNEMMPTGTYSFVAREYKNDLFSEPSNPVTVTLNTSIGSTAFPWMILLVGAIFPILGYFIYYLTRRFIRYHIGK